MIWMTLSSFAPSSLLIDSLKSFFCSKVNTSSSAMGFLFFFFVCWDFGCFEGALEVEATGGLSRRSFLLFAGLLLSAANWLLSVSICCSISAICPDIIKLSTQVSFSKTIRFTWPGLVILTVIPVFTFTDFMQGWQVLPLVLKKPLEFCASYLYRSPLGIESVAVFYHQLEIVVEFLRIRIVTAIKFLSHCREIHWPFDNLRIRRQSHSDPIYEVSTMNWKWSTKTEHLPTGS